jgi:hypothetical protein
MADQTYFVAYKDGRWEYSHHEQHFGPFSSKAQAMGQAVAAACETGRTCGRARVMASDGDGHIYTVWTYGIDAPSWALK